ncbi:hypothetical protein V6Z11_1Z096400 [Gossypium hirsutum]
MLQFDTHVVDSSLICNEMPSALLKPRERDDSIEEVLPGSAQWTAGFSEDASSSSYEGLDQSCEEWLAEYFNDAEMLLSSDVLNLTGTSDVQIGISVDAVQKQAIQTPQNIVFKGRKSIIHAAPKLASSVAYPFAFIKPCGFHGDVTLKDINQRILTHHHHQNQNKSMKILLLLSHFCFFWEACCWQTKIRTEGGKGSITIMRTKAD